MRETSTRALAARYGLNPITVVQWRRRETILALSRGAPHRCLVRHGIFRSPRDQEKTSRRQRFAETTIGCVHIDAGE